MGMMQIREKNISIVLKLKRENALISFASLVHVYSVYANDVTFISEGSFFHGMKVLATPPRRYGIA